MNDVERSRSKQTILFSRLFPIFKHLFRADGPRHKLELESNNTVIASIDVVTVWYIGDPSLGEAHPFWASLLPQT